MEDDYIIEDNSNTTAQSSNRPFLTAVAVLLFIFIAAAGCAAVSLFTRDGSSVNSQAAAATSIAATNEAILIANAQVTETIAAMETEAARPTNTPTPPPPTFTPEPSPSNTPRPTNTPVVVDADGELDGEGEAAGTPNVSGTSVFDRDSDDSTPTPIPVGNGNNNGSLPDTGFELWAIVLAAIVLVGILVMARRMRGA